MFLNIVKSLPLKIAASLGAAVLGFFSFSGCSANAPAQPGNLNGTWVYLDGDGGMVAEIQHDTILINFKSNDDTSLYWAGTFKSTANDGERINSAANVEQLQAALTGSRDASKVFTFNDGKLLFKASGMGVTKTIELEKNSSSTN